jgi:hypothetical protein
MSKFCKCGNPVDIHHSKMCDECLANMTEQNIAPETVERLDQIEETMLLVERAVADIAPSQRGQVMQLISIKLETALKEIEAIVNKCSRQKPIQLNLDPEWVKKMADAEGNGMITAISPDFYGFMNQRCNEWVDMYDGDRADRMMQQSKNSQSKAEQIDNDAVTGHKSDADKLSTLADWLDMKYPNEKAEVQEDLRRIAKYLRDKK